MRYFATVLLFRFVTPLATAQSAAPPPAPPAQAAAAPAAPAWSPSKSIGVFVFAKNGQDADKQLKDESECNGAAKQQSGIDPQAPPPAPITAEQKQAAQTGGCQCSTSTGHACSGCRERRGWGSCDWGYRGDGGKGAAIGATAGTMKGGMTQRSANARMAAEHPSRTCSKDQIANLVTASRQGPGRVWR
jgi:hypothetical protein